MYDNNYNCLLSIRALSPSKFQITARSAGLAGRVGTYYLARVCLVKTVCVRLSYVNEIFMMLSLKF